MDSHPSLLGRSIANSSRSSLDLGHSSSSSSILSLTKSISDASSQSLSSILNNPHGGKYGVYGSDASWVGWWSSSTFVAPSKFTAVAYTKLPGSELTRSDFHGYVSSISESHGRFEDIRKHTREESSGFDQESHVSGLAACLREVPSLYFKEDFALSMVRIEFDRLLVDKLLYVFFCARRMLEIKAERSRTDQFFGNIMVR